MKLFKFYKNGIVNFLNLFYCILAMNNYIQIWEKKLIPEILAEIERLSIIVANSPNEYDIQVFCCHHIDLLENIMGKKIQPNITTYTK